MLKYHPTKHTPPNAIILDIAEKLSDIVTTQINKCCDNFNTDTLNFKKLLSKNTYGKNYPFNLNNEYITNDESHYTEPDYGFDEEQLDMWNNMNRISNEVLDNHIAEMAEIIKARLAFDTLSFNMLLERDLKNCIFEICYNPYFNTLSSSEDIYIATCFTYRVFLQDYSSHIQDNY